MKGSVKAIQNKIENKRLKAKYDEACKRVLSNKYILAWILKGVVKEFEKESIQDIKNIYIEGIPQVSKKAVHELYLNEMITGMNGENVIAGEGVRTFDVMFAAVTPVKFEKLIINIEPQNDYHPGYIIDTRMVYYICRMISSQYGREFVKSDYNRIKKVYSIWICTQPPKGEANTISIYSFTKCDKIGKQKNRKKAYDKIVGVKICLGGEEYENYSGVIKLLHILLISNMDAEEKKKILQTEFGIVISGKIEEEVNEMCDLADGLFNRAKKEGWQSGMQRGMQRGMKSGRKQGEDFFAKLTQHLLNDSRTEDLLLATTDVAFREKIYREYNIK